MVLVECNLFDLVAFLFGNVAGHQFERTMFKFSHLNEFSYRINLLHSKAFPPGKCI